MSIFGITSIVGVVGAFSHWYDKWVHSNDSKLKRTWFNMHTCFTWKRIKVIPNAQWQKWELLPLSVQGIHCVLKWWCEAKKEIFFQIKLIYGTCQRNFLLNAKYIIHLPIRNIWAFKCIFWYRKISRSADYPHFMPISNLTDNCAEGDIRGQRRRPAHETFLSKC